jgi:hypothetical protein
MENEKLKMQRVRKVYEDPATPSPKPRITASKTPEFTAPTPCPGRKKPAQDQPAVSGYFVSWRQP